jgi:hypothetical protein
LYIQRKNLMEAIMKLRDLKAHRLLGPLAALMVWACSDASTAPDGVKNDVVSGTRYSVVTVPANLALNGQIILCKATETVGAPAATFTFDAVEGAVTTNPTVDVGSCETIVNDLSAPHTVDISEQALQDWDLDSIRVEAPAVCSGVVSEDGTTATARSGNDCFTRVTFWNTWTDPVVPEGCTLTQGYWKTHSDLGPAPFDETWDLLPSGSSTIFYLSTQTWYEVFHTAPAGNAYYNLAHQFMAAVLNGLAGADLSDVSAELTAADGLFAAWTPDDIGALKGSDALRQQFISLAGALAAFNEGDTGPGHCDD